MGGEAEQVKKGGGIQNNFTGFLQPCIPQRGYRVTGQVEVFTGGTKLMGTIRRLKVPAA